MLRDDERNKLTQLVLQAKDGSDQTFFCLMDYCDVLTNTYNLELLAISDDEKYDIAQGTYDELLELYDTCSDYGGYKTSDEWSDAIARRLGYDSFEDLHNGSAIL